MPPSQYDSYLLAKGIKLGRDAKVAVTPSNHHKATLLKCAYAKTYDGGVSDWNQMEITVALEPKIPTKETNIKITSGVSCCLPHVRVAVCACTVHIGWRWGCVGITY